MRAATVTLIALGLTSLSCGAFHRTELLRPTAASPRPTPSAAVGATAEVDSIHSAPADLDTVEADRVEAAIATEILAELRDRHTGLSGRELHRLAETIVHEAHRYDLDPGLVLAVIQVESRGYHLAVSPVGALGLMQLLPSTAEELAHKHGLPWRGQNSLFDPILNVKLGTAYLSQLSTKYGSVSTALAAYNWGPGRIDRRLRRGGSLPRIYVEQVMKFYEAGSKLDLASRS